MQTLKYTIIKSSDQYVKYCNALEKMLENEDKEDDRMDEVELLTFLIEKWDSEHTAFNEVDPVELLHSLMHDHSLKARDLAGILSVSKGLVSDILNYKKGMSKDTIRKLSGYFKVSQAAFNRPYPLKQKIHSRTNKTAGPLVK